MNIAIIGAGITGLSAALLLSEHGHEVTVYEQAPVPGGLGTYIKVGNNYIERYYHHFFRSDVHVMRLIKKLGIGQKLHFYPSKTSVLSHGTLYPFSSPLQLLTFSALPFLDRLRLGFALFQLKYTPQDMKKLDTISAKNWLLKHAGKQAFSVLWQPLLVGKFANYAEKIPAAWLRERVRDRSFDLGYLEGGSGTLFNALIKKLKKNKVKILLSTPVQQLVSKKNSVIISSNDKNTTFDRCLITTVSPIASRLIKNTLPTKLNNVLNAQDQLGAVCLLLELKHPIQNQYWINICDMREPVLVMIEHTNLIDKKNYGGKSLVYLANYLHRSEPRFSESDEQVIKSYTSILKKLNPNFDNSWITKTTVSRVPRAQTIFGLNSLTNRPPLKLLPNIFLANIDQMYPHDRNFNLGVELAQRVSTIMTHNET